MDDGSCGHDAHHSDGTRRGPGRPAGSKDKKKRARRRPAAGDGGGGLQVAGVRGGVHAGVRVLSGEGVGEGGGPDRGGHSA